MPSEAEDSHEYVNDLTEDANAYAQSPVLWWVTVQDQFRHDEPG